MGADQQGRRPEVGAGPLSEPDQGRLELGDEPAAPDDSNEPTRPPGRVVRVLPDVVGIDREFDYVVPERWERDGRDQRVAVGSMVRVPLAGRRVAGWVTAVDVESEAGVRLVELAKLSGIGPPAELLDLAEWAAWRWAGRRVAFLRAASPERMVAGAAAPSPPDPVPNRPRAHFDDAFDPRVAKGRVAHDQD
ncbi:MAG: hypothetical protein AAGA90_24365, partial [Actinomycetota bacterium]